MFELDGDDIAQLSDGDLRTLIGRLCEYELRLLGFSESHVTWGGHQDANDGGVDVRVALPSGSTISGFIPRPLTVFQSKAEAMTPGKIGPEMRPKGALRPTIEELAEKGGAYIIVSSVDSTSDSALRSRGRAMEDAISSSLHAAQLKTDFYDRVKIATWVRRHATLVPWVREKIGRPLSGWHGYDAWTPSPLTDGFLTDETLRIHTPGPPLGEGLSITAGLDALRNELAAPRQVVRLVGLSGVGKTRLVQALFEVGVGEHRLDPSLAVYADMAAAPDPSPSDLATQLVAEGRRIVLIIDNCKPDLHRLLSPLCQKAESQISLLTVEYDIREDQPEGTQVFKLDVSSTELIEILLRRRFPFLSQVDSRTAALFSGGNARIGIALAETVKRQGTLAGLTDNELFERLFYQGQTKSESLYLAAQACSLVYSFDGDDVSPSGELAILGGLFGIEPATLYRSVAELNSRDLAQERSKWRAILPQAIANQLATAAIRNIPWSTIQQQFVPNASIRLLRSFSRRLGLLQGNDQAVALAKQWLGPDGLLHDVARLGQDGQAMLHNIAPIVPEQTLYAIEQTLGRLGAEQANELGQYLDLLRSIAYDPILFERCVALMAAILAAQPIDGRSHTTETLISLFHCSLSGTHATVEQRIAAVENLVNSPSDRLQTLGLLALDAMLEAWSFHSSFSFEFGSQSRDFGFRAKDETEINHWFAAVLGYVETLATSGGLVATEVRAKLAEKFRGIWTRGCVPAELGRLARSICSHAYWQAGWLAVKQTLRFEGKEMLEEYLQPLRLLEIDLRPSDVKQEVRSIVFSTGPMFDFDDHDEDDPHDYQAARLRKLSRVRSLGVTVVSEPAIFASILPEIVASEGELLEFGAGLFEGSEEPEHTWHQLVGAIIATEERKQRPEALAGFLHALNGVNEGLATRFLDEVADDEALARFYPYLQVRRPIGEGDVARLKRSLASGRTPVAHYMAFGFGGVTEPIPPKDFKEILLTISAKPGGHDVAMELLHMRQYGDSKLEENGSEDLLEAGRTLLGLVTFDRRDDGGDYRASEVARHCLAGEEGAAVAEELCKKLKIAEATGETYALYHDDLLLTLFQLQPIASLEGLCGGDNEQLREGIAIIGDANERKPVLSGIPRDDLMRWCDVDPTVRYPAIAQVIQYTEVSKDSSSRVSWSAIALSLLKSAPDASAVLKNFVARFRPYSGWVGTFAPTLEARITLLDDLDDFPELKEVATLEKEKLRAAAAEMRLWASESDREHYESFE